MRVEVYGEGGHDPAKPHNNVVDAYDVPDEADALADARATLAAALDPKVANPSTAKRLDAIEQLLASQVAPDLLG